jgi:hypothetical protein
VAFLLLFLTGKVKRYFLKKNAKKYKIKRMRYLWLKKKTKNIFRRVILKRLNVPKGEKREGCCG